MAKAQKQYVAPVDEKTIGERLREARKRRGLTQVELAAMLGIKQSLISGYESGSIRLHGALVASFADALNVSADELLDLKRSKETGPIVKDRRFLRRLPRIDQLPKQKRQLLLGTIDAVLKSAAATG